MIPAALQNIKLVPQKLLTASIISLVLTSHATLAANCCHNASARDTMFGNPQSSWHVQLTEGWDSLYMFRGVNMLREDSRYGSSLLWTDLSVAFSLTPNDILTADVWNAFGLGKSSFKETDVSLMYTHTFGNLFVSAGYMMMIMTSMDMEMYNHELHGQIGYNIALGSVIITPSVNYFFNLGPDAPTNRYGMAPSASSYLNLRTDISIPLYKDVIILAPWMSYGQNFRFNAQEKPNGTSAFFNGANDFEVGISLPIKINHFLTVSGYGAYSYNFEHLVNTSLSTFWGGAKVSLNF